MLNPGSANLRNSRIIQRYIRMALEAFEARRFIRMALNLNEYIRIAGRQICISYVESKQIPPENSQTAVCTFAMSL